MESNYLQKLSLEHPEVGERYQMKLKLVNGLDLFTTDMDTMEYSIDVIPPVTNMDIISYLVYSHNFHTKEQIEAFKSLQAFKYFESSFVLKVGTICRDNIVVLVGKVHRMYNIRSSISDDVNIFIVPFENVEVSCCPDYIQANRPGSGVLYYYFVKILSITFVAVIM